MPVAAMAPVRLALAFCAAASACGRSGGSRRIDTTFEDRFERGRLGPDWLDTGGDYSLVDGHLRVRGARNHPLWLRRPLPRDVRIEFRGRSQSPDGDIKVEVFGDGRSFATEDSYTATSYVLVFGGWRNTLNVLARMDEHGDDRLVRRAPSVVPGRWYRFEVERVGAKISWWIDGAPMHELDDAEPLEGQGHEHFAFNDWDAELWFDDLVVRALP